MYTFACVERMFCICRAGNLFCDLRSLVTIESGERLLNSLFLIYSRCGFLQPLAFQCDSGIGFRNLRILSCSINETLRLR